MDSILETLRKNLSLRELSTEVLELFSAISHTATLAHGELFAAKDTEAVGVVIVASGSLCASSFNDRGQQFAFSMIETGGVWGLVAVLEPSRLMRETRAVGHTEVLILPKGPFLALLNARVELWRFFVQVLCRHLRRAHHVIDVIALLSLRERLARQLYMAAARRLAEAPIPSTFRVDHTQDDLAALLVVSRHAVNRELKQLEREKLITTGYGYVDVNNPDGLRRIFERQVVLL